MDGAASNTHDCPSYAVSLDPGLCHLAPGWGGQTARPPFAEGWESDTDALPLQATGPSLGRGGRAGGPWLS